MSEIMSNILNRRSIRVFTGEPIPPDVLAIIVEAGRAAPSGMNTHTRMLTVIQRPAIIASLSDAIGTALNTADYNMRNPTAIIIVSEKREDHNIIANAACAMQNMMLAAHSLGIGSVWINQLRDTTDHPDVRNVLADVGIPDSHVAVCSLTLGYPAESPEMPDKSDMVVNWYL